LVLKRNHGDGEVMEIVCATHSSCGFAGGLNGGEQEGHEDADDGDDDEQLDQRKAT
jgi:hypothetical protein